MGLWLQLRALNVKRKPYLIQRFIVADSPSAARPQRKHRHGVLSAKCPVTPSRDGLCRIAGRWLSRSSAGCRWRPIGGASM